MSDSNYVTVCANCFKASCWQGIFMCDDAKYANVTECPKEKLVEMGLEHPEYWEVEYDDLVKDCICVDPENCTEPVPGYRCKAGHI